MVSGVTEKLTKREAQRKENKNSKEEQAAEQESSEQSKRAENRKLGKVTKEVARREEDKEVEQEETLVDETPASSRLAEVQDRAEENEITEKMRGTMTMMLSSLSGAEEEMSVSLQKELPKTLIDEG